MNGEAHLADLSLRLLGMHVDQLDPQKNRVVRAIDERAPEPPCRRSQRRAGARRRPPRGGGLHHKLDELSAAVKAIASQG